MNEPLHILTLHAENFKKISVADIAFTGDTTILSGPNAAGKSSVIDLIYAMLGGKDADPKKPIKTGAKKSTNTLTLGNGQTIKYQIKKTFTEAGSYLQVETSEGAVLKSPQAFLDALIGKIAFDPIEWVEMKDKKKQRQILLDLAGVNTDDLDIKYDQLYERRTQVGRDLKNYKGELVGCVFHKDAPAAEVSVAELSNQLNEATLNNANIDKKQTAIAFQEKSITDKVIEIQETQNRIEELKQQLAEEETTLQERQKEHKDLLATEKTMKTEFKKLKRIDTAPIQAKIDSAEADNKKVRDNAAYKTAKGKVDTTETNYNTMTNELEGIEKTKRQRLAAAKMPIAGLSVTEDDILYNNEPIEQASAAERAKVSVAVGMELNPTLRVLATKNGSLLDSHNLAAIRELAKDKGFKIIVEKVDESGKLGIYFEDGTIKAVNE